MEFHHVSVMLEETVQGLVTDPQGTYVDCTLGGGGHSHRIAELLAPEGRLIGLDQDEAAIKAAAERLSDVGCQVEIVHSNFRHLEKVLHGLGVEQVDGVVFDLGVSSHQIDTAERGFSYMQDAPLDMRMDPEASLSAYEVVNTYSQEELARIFHDYGEERWGKRIAEFIVKEREESPIKTTGELVEVICKAVPKAVRRASAGHPAKRIFQAIRIEVNDELGILENAYDKTRELHALTPQEIIEKEPELLVKAKAYMPRICFDSCDVLVVDEIGKDISGDGMDPNISGRFCTDCASGGIDAQRVAVLDLTAASHGNANGLGLADVTTRRMLNKMDFEATYPNTITNKITETMKIPMVMGSDKLAIQMALRTCFGVDEAVPRVVRIQNTMKLEYIEISEAMLEEAKRNPQIEIVSEAAPLPFDEDDNLLGSME